MQPTVLHPATNINLAAAWPTGPMVVLIETRLRYRREKARGLNFSVGDDSGPVAPTGTYNRTPRPWPALCPTTVLLPAAGFCPVTRPPLFDLKLSKQ
jgi:hypothetical protein